MPIPSLRRPVRGVAPALVLLALLVPSARAELTVPHEPLVAPPHPRGIVVVLHAGGWFLTGPAPTATARAGAARFQRLGWTTVNVDYRPASEVEDAVAAARWAVRRRPALPVCLYGESAGGQLALVAVSRVRGVRCVVTQGGLIDPTLLVQDYPGFGYWGRVLIGDAIDTTANPTWLATHGRLDTVHLLTEYSREDGTTPVAAARRYCAAARECELVTVGPGAEPFFHGGTTRADYGRFAAREGTLLRGVRARWLRRRSARSPAGTPTRRRTSSR